MTSLFLIFFSQKYSKKKTSTEIISVEAEALVVPLSMGLLVHEKAPEFLAATVSSMKRVKLFSFWVEKKRVKFNSENFFKCFCLLVFLNLGLRPFVKFPPDFFKYFCLLVF